MKRITASIKNLTLSSAVVSVASTLLLLGSLGAPQAFAQSCNSTWTGGGGDTNWSNGANWNPFGEPGSGSSVCIQLSGAAVNMDVSDTILNLTLGSTDSLTLPANFGNLTVDGSSINNSGQIFITGSTNSPAFLYLGTGVSATLSGGGTVLMNDSNNSVIEGFGPGPYTLFNDETIEGAGEIEGATLDNNSTGVINANISGASITMGRAGTESNTGLLEATNGGQFIFGSGTLINTGGTIEANGTGSWVGFIAQGAGGQTITGGTLTTSNGGIIYSEQSTVVDGTNGNTVTNTGSIVVPDAGNHPGTSFQGTFNNTGSIQVLSAGDGVNISIPNGQTWTAMGSGSITLGDGTNNVYNNDVGITGGTFVNQQVLQGTGQIENLTAFSNSGTIDDNVPVGSANLQLFLGRAGASTNTGTIEASNGGALVIDSTTITSTGGTFEATGTGSYVFLDGSLTVTGGTYTTSSGGTIYASNSTLLDGTTSTINNSGTLYVNDIGNTSILFVQGTLNNTGTIQVESAGDEDLLGVPNGETFTLTGRGTVMLGDGTNNSNNSQNGIGDNIISSGNFVNQSTVEGPGFIANINSITNNGTINDNVAAGANNLQLNIGGNVGTTTNNGTIEASNGGFVTVTANFGQTFTNSGTLLAAASSTIEIQGSNFTNLSGTTLTGGKYNVTGTLQIPGNITTNDAGITLTGTSSQILNGSSDALSGFVTNGNKGSFTLAGNQNFTTSGNFTNQGSVKVSKGSTFTVGSSGSYTQSSGQITVDGTLTTSSAANFTGGSYFDTGTGSIKISKGSVFGNGGNLAANVSNAGTVTPADSATLVGKLTITGTYTQGSTGALDANIKAATSGQFNVLSVTGTAGLSGTLNIKLLNHYVPPVGTTLEILTASHVNGTFPTVNGTSINSNEHFQVNYNSNNVTLQVVAGP